MARDKPLTFGPFRLDPGTESIWRAGREIRLRPKTFAVLRYLAERPGRLVTKDELLEAVWSDVEVGEAALTVCVNEIRKALGDEARAPRFVETVHRRGYRFLGTAPAGPLENAGTPPPAAPARGIVGRERELDTLAGWLAGARQGDRRVGFVTGEVGIGKTALVETFLAGPHASDCRVGRGQCLDHYGAGEAYLPVLEAVSRLARGPDGDQVLAVLHRHAPTWLVQLPALLGPQDLAALQPRVVGPTRERMLREMAEALEALAADRPLVLVLEDLHWSDPSTLDLIAAVARRREPARLLLIATYRPLDAIVRQHPLRAVAGELAVHGACEELALDALGADHVARYLAARCGAEVGARLGRTIHRRTDGLPLFVVNVVDALIRRDLLVERAGRWVMSADEAAVETSVPESLRQMIEQQLAALAPDDLRLLETASVAGPTFAVTAVGAALGEAAEAIEERCAALSRREQFLHAAGVVQAPDGIPAAAYEFRHGLYQQVLYERLPMGRRAGLHLRIAEAEEAALAEQAGERAAVLAVHFERAHAAARSIRYRRLAAEHALQRCAFPEAIEHLTRGRDLLDRVADGEERLALELDVLTTLGPALYSARGATAPEVEAVYVRARELAERLSEPRRLYPALFGLWYVDYGRGHYAPARALGEQLLALAEREGDTGRLLEAHHALWPTVFAMGEPAAALAHVERGLALYDPAQHRAQISIYGGHDTGVCARNHLAVTRWLLGCPDRALEALGEALALQERLAHPMTTLGTLTFATWVHLFRAELAACRQHAERLVALAGAQGAPNVLAEGTAVLASLEALEDPTTARLEALYRRLVELQVSRTVWRSVASFCLLAETAAGNGAIELGLFALAAIAEPHRDAFFAPEIERVRGELLQRRDGPEPAERCFRGAMAIAAARGERSLQLRAAVSLARLLARRGGRAEARRTLADVLAAFTEGFETADLRAARALLDELDGGRAGGGPAPARAVDRRSSRSTHQ
jgi:DNA-binding winged helix-turn-helix (wHTH) protein